MPWSTNDNCGAVNRGPLFLIPGGVTIASQWNVEYLLSHMTIHHVLRNVLLKRSESTYSTTGVVRFLAETIPLIHRRNSCVCHHALTGSRDFFSRYMDRFAHVLKSESPLHMQCLALRLKPGQCFALRLKPEKNRRNAEVWTATIKSSPPVPNGVLRTRCLALITLWSQRARNVG